MERKETIGTRMIFRKKDKNMSIKKLTCWIEAKNGEGSADNGLKDGNDFLFSRARLLQRVLVASFNLLEDLHNIMCNYINRI